MYIDLSIISVDAKDSVIIDAKELGLHLLPVKHMSMPRDLQALGKKHKCITNVTPISTG